MLLMRCYGLLLYDETVQFYGQVLLVVVTLLGRHVDGFQGRATFEGTKQFLNNCHPPPLIIVNHLNFSGNDTIL